MKKLLVTILMFLTLVAIQKSPSVQAQEVGVWDILFEEATHGFLMNEISHTLIKLHLLIAEKDIEMADYEGDVLTSIRKLEELTKTDVISLLNLSVNKQETLIKYLNECDQELQKWGAISAYMTQEMNILKWDMQSCLTDKNISDKAYFDAIDRYDQKIMEASLKESISYETCASENRIQYNAKASIAGKLVFYLGVLQNKYNILFAKQDILAKNFEVFRDNILPDLNQIDQLLQQYKF